jgi:hypothetical protein
MQTYSKLVIDDYVYRHFDCTGWGQGNFCGR